MITVDDFDFKNDKYVPLSSLITESEEIVDTNHASTVRSLALLSDIVDIGTATEAKLYDQGDKLLACDANLDLIDADVVEAKDELKSISSFFGQMRVSIFGRTKQKHKESSSINRDKTVNQETKQRTPSQTRTMLQNGDFSHLSNEKTIAATEDNLEEMASKINIIHQISLNMNQELQEHNNLLAAVNSKIEKTNTDVKNVTRKTRRQI